MRAFQETDPEDSHRQHAKVKGTLVVTLMKFMRAKGIEPERVIAGLPTRDRDLLHGILLPSGWYPADMFSRFVEAVAAVAGSGDIGARLKEMGRFSAQTNLGPGGLRRTYIREDDPHHVLEAISRIYANVYSSGTRTYQRAGERSATICGYGTRVAHDHCLWVAGWLQRVVELSGGKDVSVGEVQCEGAGDPHCEYHVAWT